MHLLRKSFLPELLSLAGVLAVAQVLEYRQRLRERELRASQLEASLSQAQLEVLRSELQLLERLALQGAQPLGKNSFKIPLAQALVRRALATVAT